MGASAGESTASQTDTAMPAITDTAIANTYLLRKGAEAGFTTERIIPFSTRNCISRRKDPGISRRFLG